MMRAAGGMAILIFAIVTVAFFWIRAEKARAVRAEAEAKDERNRAIAARRDAEELGYLNAIALAESTVARGDFARAAAVLERQPASLRGWEWGRLQALCHQDAFRIRVADSGRTYAVLLPDGETIAAGNEESDGIALYDIASGEARGSLPGGSSLQALALDPTRGRLLGAYWGGTVRVWDPEAGETLFELRGHDGPVKSVVCSPDGAHYLTASLDGSARLWDAEYGVEVRRFDREGGVVEAGFSLDSQRCFSFSKDGAIRMRGIEGESSTEMEGKGCTALSWAAEGRGLIVGSTDGEVQMRPVADGLPVQLLPESGVTVESLGLGPEGKRLLVGYADGRGVLYDLESKRVVRELRGNDAPLTDLGFDPKGRFLYSADAEGTLRFWHPRSSPAGSVIEGPGGDVSSLAVSDSGERLVAASWEGGAWWASVADPAPAALSEPGSPVLDLALTPGADRVALAHADGTVRVCDVGKNASTLSFEAHEGRVFAIDWFATAWSPDGSMLLTGGEDNRVRLWRASDGSQLAVLDVHSGPVHAVGFGRGSTFLTGAWESFEKRLTESNISSLRLWQWDGAAVVSPDSVPLPYEKDVLSVAFSPDGGKAVVVSAEENEVIVWDLNAKKRILRLRGHRAGILAAAWSPDGRRIFTSASDGTVKLWQATSGRDLMTLSSGDGPVYALACDSHGQSLFGGLDDGRTRVWSVLPWDESEERRKSRRREAWLRQLGKAAPSGESTGATRGGEPR
jgi:WD40 repeat protein